MDITPSGISTKLRTAILTAVLIAEVGSIALVSNITFSQSALLSLLTACLVTGQCVLVIIAVLRRVSEKMRLLFLSILFRSGAVLSFSGLLGALLIAMSSKWNVINSSPVMTMANLMLMIGLNFGIPLVVTTIYEEDFQKRLKATAIKDQSSENSDLYTAN